MNRIARILMGTAIIAVLVPALAWTMPGRFSSLTTLVSSQPENEIAIAASEEARPIFQNPGSITAAADPAPAGSSEGEGGVDGPADEETSTTEATAETTTVAETDTTEADGDDDSDDQKKSTTTTKPKSTTTAPKDNGGGGSSGGSGGSGGNDSGGSGSSPVVTGTITGTACPCTVTGTVELKGNISLQGDIMVNGGTLVARPGVDLNGNGYQIMFMNGGKADFQGSKTSTWSGSGSNANLSRDINFRNLRRIMFHQGAGKSTLRYFRVSDSGGPNLGDYSIHFHLNGNTTRGTLVEGVVVTGSKNHAFVPHGSHGITFRDTIAKNGRCAAYWWDQPDFQSTSQVNNSNDILYDHVLADGVTNCPGDSRGFRLSAIELGAGKGNTVRNSVARNINPSHQKDCAGFLWPELHSNQPSSWTFTNNATYNSACNGIFVWQNDSEKHVINGFKGDGIDHGAYLNRYEYRNVDVDFIEIHAVGWSVTGGSADVVTAFRHTLDGGPVVFKNVSIGRFIVNNTVDGGTMPATYQLDNTGLSCGDIEYQSVVPGTKVIINGSEC